jgi:hypothetical protein
MLDEMSQAKLFIALVRVDNATKYSVIQNGVALSTHDSAALAILAMERLAGGSRQPFCQYDSVRLFRVFAR